MGCTPAFPERRQAPRYRLALPVELAHGIGITRDISATGVFFFTAQPLTLGAGIVFALLGQDPRFL
jgi:hypothetical protein